MRSFTLLILSLGIILTANLGFTSTVPDFIKNLKALISADDNHNIATRSVANPVTDLAADAEEGGTYRPFWDWHPCGGGKHGMACALVKPSDEADTDDTANNGGEVAKRDTIGAAVDLAANTEEGGTYRPFWDWHPCGGGKHGMACALVKPSDEADTDDTANHGAEIAKRDTTSAAVGLDPNSEEGSTVDGRRRCRWGASCWKRSDDGNVVSDDGDMNIDHLASSTSSNTLFERQLVGPIIAETNKPCAKAIFAKYEHIDLTTLSDADKKTLVDAIMHCQFNPSKYTTTPILHFRGNTDLTMTKEATAKRCTNEQLIKAYFDVQEKFKGDRNKPEDLAVMAAEVRST
ncbi:hypothetical protein GJ744_000215 [Endocarpon pusillum]|uniref:Uncharacterized protein n=1 Tax=Endocarpon pusillum TaxID=364733 RepID=A0A8H7B0C3_9EURO|nr:hypothetical protein GJ744_000215 [Endocarpon pusillum]